MSSLTLMIEAIAYCLHKKGYRYWMKEDLISEINKLPIGNEINKDLIRDLFDTFSVNTSPIKIYKPGHYGFSQVGLQERRTAQYIRRYCDTREIIKEHCHDPWWQEVILHLAAQLDHPDDKSAAQATQLIEWLMAEPDDEFCSCLRLAGRCLTTVGQQRIGREARDKVVEALYSLFKTARFSRLRRYAQEILVEIGGQEICSFFIEQLQNDTLLPQIRDGAAIALGWLSEKIETELIMEINLKLLRDNNENPIVRAAALTALCQGVVQPDSLASDLLAFLRDKQVPVAIKRIEARNAVHLIRENGDSFESREKLLTPLMIETFLRDPDVGAEIRIDMAYTVGKRPSFRRVLERLNEDKQVAIEVRQCVKIALGKLGDRSVLSEIASIARSHVINSPIQHEALLALRASSLRGNETATRQLARLGPDRKLPDALRIAAINALSFINRSAHLDSGTKQAFTERIERVMHKILDRDNGDKAVASAAKVVLSEIRYKQGSPLVVSVIIDPEVSVDLRVRAILLYAEVANVIGVPMLVELSDHDKEAAVRLAAAVALEKLQRRSPLPVLLEKLGKDNPSPELIKLATIIAEGLVKDPLEEVQAQELRRALTASSIDPALADVAFVALEYATMHRLLPDARSASQ
jgi:HEAT repeat protein